MTTPRRGSRRPPLKVRNSERLSFTECRWKWNWAYNERLRPTTPNRYLRFGTIAHKVLELRYPPGKKRGPSPVDLWDRLYADELAEATAYGFRDEDGEWHEAGEIGHAMFSAYLDAFGEDDEYEVVAAEQRFSTRVAPGVYHVGTIDGVWRHRPTKRLLLKEWKTTSRPFVKHLGLDEQASTYWTYGPKWLKRKGLIAPDDELHHILYTFLRRAMPDARPKDQQGRSLNKDGTVSKQQPAPLFQRLPVYRGEVDRRNLHARVLAEIDEMTGCRDGRLAIYKSPSRQHCDGCPFRDPCEQHETGADYKLLLKTAYEQWEPYADHELVHEGK